MNTSEVLYGAADHIATFGHHKGSAFADPANFRTSSACVVGAIGVVAGAGAVDAWSAEAVLRQYLGRASHVFNDDPETTADDVVTALRAAALIAAAREVDVVTIRGERFEVVPVVAGEVVR